jgi:hypothetical protein
MRPLQPTVAGRLSQIAASLWRGYLVLLAALSIVCLVTAALWLVAGLLGFPLP